MSCLLCGSAEVHITGSGADFAAGVPGIVAEEERKVTNRFAREAEARAVAMEQQALEHAEGLVSERWGLVGARTHLLGVSVEQDLDHRVGVGGCSLPLCT